MANNDQAMVAGYYTAADGGVGSFTYNSGSSAILRASMISARTLGRVAP
jgi:hypothetical protein